MGAGPRLPYGGIDRSRTLFCSPSFRISSPLSENPHLARAPAARTRVRESSGSNPLTSFFPRLSKVKDQQVHHPGRPLRVGKEDLLECHLPGILINSLGQQPMGRKADDPVLQLLLGRVGPEPSGVLHRLKGKGEVIIRVLVGFTKGSPSHLPPGGPVR